MSGFAWSAPRRLPQTDLPSDRMDKPDEYPINAPVLPKGLRTCLRVFGSLSACGEISLSDPGASPRASCESVAVNPGESDFAAGTQSAKPSVAFAIVGSGLCLYHQRPKGVL